MILGLSGSGKDWARVQGQQYAQLASKRWIRFMLHALAALSLVFVYWDNGPALVLGLWAAGVFLLALHGVWIDRSLGHCDIKGLTRLAYVHHTANALAKGLIWGAAALLFAPLGNTGANAVAWSLVALLALASATSRFSAPLGSVVFSAALGAGWAIGLAGAQEYHLAAIACFTGLLAAAVSIESARGVHQARVAELDMNESSEVVSLLLREYEDSDADWLFQLDKNRRLRSVSPRLAFALRRELPEIEGKSFIELISGNSWSTGQFAPSLHDLAEKLKNRESFSNLIVEVTIKDERRWWELSGTPMLDERGEYTGFRGVGSDVTQQQESSEKIAYLARYDTLTALPNRLMLHEAVSDALRYAEKWRTRCAFLMIDLDRFKAVNDSLGHLVGDKLLAQVAQRLQALMGEGESCGRLGGDEFAVVIRDASDRARTEALARGVIERLSEPYRVDDQLLYVGASIGSAVGPRDGKSVEELMRNADLALYRSKDAGGGEHCEYEPSLHASAEERRQLEFSLRTALKRDELVLHYQPVVDANTEELVSFEALVRWISPEHGFVSPAKFIPLAEDTRLIVPIGLWVMRQAMEECARWPAPVKVNINVSPEQLIEPDFVTTVVRALSGSGLSPERVEIEVTESIFLKDAHVARKALEAVMALGCSVALDDFGTGYSSLGYLRTLKFSTIKVDRTFVQGAAQENAESLAIIRAVVAMADSLGMTTTAEGVENAEEAAMIRNLNCTKIQGYHFGRPMPAEEARQLMHRTLRKTA
ncbi:putative bifunctional diguanylate cyclase/phosphodiesterase [Qipengyuania sediminis]|uniref:putative bifunctional diguanylate cyclase/phosphodiesterase n=1 Tax=Qipengyuania sediminis TaxID=1532023 RepID=UPI0010593734|nr:EAL domain-containing protein [Qipengyuania sediminis]